MLPIITQKQPVDVPQTFSIFLTYLTMCGSRVLHVLLICYCLLSPSLPTQFIYYLPLISSHALRLNSLSLSLRPAPPLSPLVEFALKQPPQFFGFFFFYNEIVIAGYQPAISVCDLSQFLSFLYLFLSFFFFILAKCAWIQTFRSRDDCAGLTMLILEFPPSF